MNDDYELLVVGLLDHAEAALGSAATLEDLLRLWHEAQNVCNFKRTRELSYETLYRAAKFRLTAERRLGLFLRGLLHADELSETEVADLEGYPWGNRRISLGEMNISGKTSSRAQRIASIPEDAFNTFLEDAFRASQIPTLNDAQEVGRTYLPPRFQKAKSTDEEEPFVSRVAPLVEQRKRFATIFAAPDWPSKTARPAEVQRFIERLTAEPVADVAAEHSSLHLLVGAAYLREAIDLIRAWEFAYRSFCVFDRGVKRETKYWDSPQDFLLLGVRGEPVFAVRGHSGLVKPQRSRVFLHEQIANLIQQVSPGPYLELFGHHCSGRDDWTCCGCP